MPLLYVTDALVSAVLYFWQMCEMQVCPHSSDPRPFQISSNHMVRQVMRPGKFREATVWKFRDDIMTKVVADHGFLTPKWLPRSISENSSVLDIRRWNRSLFRFLFFCSLLIACPCASTCSIYNWIGRQKKLKGTHVTCRGMGSTKSSVHSYVIIYLSRQVRYKKNWHVRYRNIWSLKR